MNVVASENLVASKFEDIMAMRFEVKSLRIPSNGVCKSKGWIR